MIRFEPDNQNFLQLTEEIKAELAAITQSHEELLTRQQALIEILAQAIDEQQGLSHEQRQKQRKLQDELSEIGLDLEPTSPHLLLAKLVRNLLSDGALINQAQIQGLNQLGEGLEQLELGRLVEYFAQIVQHNLTAQRVFCFQLLAKQPKLSSEVRNKIDVLHQTLLPASSELKPEPNNNVQSDPDQLHPQTQALS